MTLKVFVVGLPKSGTKTLQEAMKQAGYTSRHHKIEKGGEHLATMLRRGYDRSGDPMRYLKGIEAITESSKTGQTRRWSYWACTDYELIRRIRELCPDCLMLLNTRDPHQWLESINNWKDLRARMSKMLGFKIDRKFIEWQQSHYQKIREMFSDDPNFLEVPIDSPEVPQLIGDKLGHELPWWGVKNPSEKSRGQGVSHPQGGMQDG